MATNNGHKLAIAGATTLIVEPVLTLAAHQGERAAVLQRARA